MININSKSNAHLPYRRLVVKLGTGLLTGGSSKLNLDIMSQLTRQVAQLHHEGRELLIVSSGAIAAGRQKLGVSKQKQPKDVPFRQVLASVGQHHLMQVYEQLFSQHDVTVAQALLTRSDLADRAGYLNTRNTLLALLELRVLCIINENDVVAIDEIQEAKFGDNDNLSAMVANLVDADLLLILSDIAGLYTADPHRNSDARLIPQVDQITEEIEQLASGSHSRTGTGGMVTKIESAKLATASGVTMIIADGREKDIILRAASGEAVGTRFMPTGRRESRERWLLSGLATRGKLVVDAGAARALTTQNGSLLAAGIQHVEGKFQRGDIVNIYDLAENRLGCGISNYSSTDISLIKGAHSRKIVTLLGYDYGAEVVHRNNLVIG